MAEELLLQAIKALAYYAALIVIMRLAGKRLAGQTTTFDLDRADHARCGDSKHRAA